MSKPIPSPPYWSTTEKPGYPEAQTRWVDIGEGTRACASRIASIASSVSAGMKFDFQ